MALTGFLIAPLIALAAVLLWAATLGDRLPEQVAIHFGSTGQANGFGSLAVLLIGLGIAGVVCCVPLGLMASRADAPLLAKASLGPMSPLVAALFAGILVDSLVAQLDGATGSDVTIGGLWGWAALAAGILIGGVTVAALKPAPLPEADTAPPDTLPRGPRSAPVTVGAGAGYWALTVICLAVCATLACGVPAVGVTVLLIVGVALVPTLRVTVRIDDDAVRLRAMATQTIPLGSVTGAVAISYNWGESGGLGLRSYQPYGDNTRWALATRSGPAVLIRTTGTDWVIVVDEAADADTLAGDVNARCDALHARA